MTDNLTREINAGSAVTLHGSEYRLTLPVRAVLAFKQRTGVDLFNLEKDHGPAETTENMLALFHCMIAEHHPEVTFDDVTLLVDLGNIRQTRQAVIACIVSYLPPEEKASEGELPNVETAQTF